MSGKFATVVSRLVEKPGLLPTCLALTAAGVTVHPRFVDRLAVLETMTTLCQALRAMEHLLDRAGEEYWRDWMREDVERCETAHDATHHLSAYGGMGSFNDVVICRENKHRVTKAQEPWVQNLFEILKGMCYRLAHTPRADKSLPNLVVSHTGYVPIVEAFDHGPGDKGPLVRIARLLGNLSQQLHGWRCLDCGHAEITRYDLENFIARQLLPAYIIRVGKRSSLEKVVDAAFATDFPGLQALRERLRRAAVNSGIHVRAGTGWMRPCPRCGSNHTAVYRWEAAPSDALAFRPAKDNLPMTNAG